MAHSRNDAIPDFIPAKDRRDYTTMQPCIPSGRPGERIAWCPRCGRKGAYHPAYTGIESLSRKERRHPAEFIHTGYVTHAPIELFHTSAYCWIDEDEEQYVSFGRKPKKSPAERTEGN